MTPTSSINDRLDTWITKATSRYDRLVGMAILRVVLGVAGVQFYISDYPHRDFLWGPRGYLSPTDAQQQIKDGQFSFYFLDDSAAWFTTTFHLGLVAAVAFTIFGGRCLTVTHAAFLWSIYLRNQDILEGGDNLARILLICMVFTVSNAHLAPGARRRRTALATTAGRRPLIPLLHNAAAQAMLVQIAVLYFVAGYLKATADIWTNGTAMYYISHLHQFSVVSWYPRAMNNAYLGWAVGYFTFVVEIAVPFVIWSQRSLIRKVVTASLEGMHIGIMVCMGLGAFGLIMIGADSLMLTDDDYRALARRARRAFQVPRRGRTPSSQRLTAAGPISPRAAVGERAQT